MKLERCEWGLGDALYEKYHDEEWGVPVHDERLLFEFLILEGVQAGLSWITVLRKRENYRKAYLNFDVNEVAKFGPAYVEKLMADPGLIRNRLKIQASIKNAQAFLKVQSEFGSFDSYIWRFTGSKTIQNSWKSVKDVPAESPESIKMSKDMKKRGFTFVGPTICYALMQATGMINDHRVGCYRHAELKE